jgi:hypothetical protein
MGWKVFFLWKLYETNQDFYSKHQVTMVTLCPELPALNGGRTHSSSHAGNRRLSKNLPVRRPVRMDDLNDSQISCSSALALGKRYDWLQA